jgi:hypothetical protein
MVEDLIKRLRMNTASWDHQREAADLIEQQAARLTALESERDALLAAAGKEAVGQAGAMPGTDGFTMACFKASDVPIGTRLYTAPTAALEKGDGRDAERWRYQALDAQAKLGRAVNILSRIHSFMTPEDVRLPDGRVMRFSNAEVEREMLRGLCAAIRAVPDELAALSQKAGEQQ